MIRSDTFRDERGIDSGMNGGMVRASSLLVHGIHGVRRVHRVQGIHKVQGVQKVHGFTVRRPAFTGRRSSEVEL